ncbi:O-methyltransferase [Gigaspora rosea]|uniref:O-methyltransferase n=1 Tax=Gigaspora rosea TaxID=44941 RepID=A0A397UGT6_9GLOM|nr:O-methyltransferase [Gigaspora rosea]
MFYRLNILRRIVIKNRFFPVQNSIPKQNFYRSSSVLSAFNASDEQYSIANSTKQSPILESVHEKTTALGQLPSVMIVSSLQGSFLKSLVQISKATRVLEIGSLTGYSALCMAEGLKERGSEAKIVTLEKDEEFFKTAKENVESSGLGHMIELKLGAALDTLSTLDNAIPYDLIFIDADKENYINYYNSVLERNLLSDDGTIIVDNVLFGGSVSQVAEGKDLFYLHPIFKSAAEHLHLFNEYVAKDQRTTQVILPCFDGITFIRKRKV